MHKCSKCGREFEGNFCLNCGEEWSDEKECPKCRQKIKGSSKFCSNCGYSFYNIKADNSEKRNSILFMICSWLKYIPILTLLIFAGLLFIIFSAPVAVLPSQEFMGEKIPSYSYGNVYSMYSGILSEIPELKNIILTLIIFSIITLICAIVLLIIRFKLSIKDRKMINKIYSSTGFIFYFIFFVVGCIICGKLSFLDADMGVISVGACPILLIVFSLFFIILNISAFVAEFLLKKQFPSIINFEASKIEREIEAKKKHYEQYYETHSAPIKPIYSGNKKVFRKQSCIYKHEKLRYEKAKDGEPSKAAIWLDLNKVWVSICVIVLVIAITVICIIASILNNKFRVGMVEKIEIGFTQEQVYEILGAPYATSTDYKWVYYDNDYTELLDKLANNAEQQNKAMLNGDDDKLIRLINEETQLQEKLNSLTYKYIEIEYSENKKVIGVVFDVSCCNDLNYDKVKKSKDLNYLYFKHGIEYAKAGFYLEENRLGEQIIKFCCSFSGGSSGGGLSESFWETYRLFAQVYYEDGSYQLIDSTDNLKEAVNSRYTYINGSYYPKNSYQRDIELRDKRGWGTYILKIFPNFEEYVKAM